MWSNSTKKQLVVQSSGAVSLKGWHLQVSYSLTDESGLGVCHGNSLPDCMGPGLMEIVFQGWPFKSSEENLTTVSSTRRGRTTAH